MGESDSEASAGGREDKLLGEVARVVEVRDNEVSADGRKGKLRGEVVREIDVPENEDNEDTKAKFSNETNKNENERIKDKGGDEERNEDTQTRRSTKGPL